MKLSCSATVGQSRAKMKPWKKWAIFASGLFLLVCIAVSSLYVAQVKYGVCLKEGRVLSPEELRERVLVNFVNLRLQNISAANWYFGNSFFWVGLSNLVAETDAKKLFEKAYQSSQSIEESFGLEVLVKGREKRYKKVPPSVSADRLKEPFVLVSYDVIDRTGRGTLYVSSDIKETSYDLSGNKFKKTGLIESLFKDRDYFLKSLCGYNNHYYIIQRFHFSRECCDIRFSDKLSQEGYAERKRKAFENTISSIEKLQSPRIAFISNCGDILTKPDEMGSPSRDFQWFFKPRKGATQ